jgi:Plavaka transposase
MDRLTADRAQLSSQCPGDDDTPMFEYQESNDAHRGESSRSPTPPTRVDYHPTPGRATEIDRMATAEGTDPVKSDVYLRDPWYPFNDETEYKLARWFVETEVPKRKINEFFNMGLSPLEGDASTHFASADGLWKKVAKMSHSDLLMFKEKTVDFGIPNTKASPMFYRDPVKLLKYILKQPAYARDMVWNPVREFDSLGRRVYSELHTADWWWEEQVSTFLKGVS